jgi:hypothetical protein
MRNTLIFLSFVCVMAMGISSAHATPYLDNFSSGNLSAYTMTDILAQGTNYATSFVSTAGVIEINRTTGTYPEQEVMLTNNSLNIGETLRVDTAWPADNKTGNADIGIVVSGVSTDLSYPNPWAPKPALYSGSNVDTRQNILWMYLKGGGSSGINGGWGAGQFNGTTNVNPGYMSDAAIYPTITGLYITHVSSGVFDVGYTTASGDVLWKQLTGATWDANGTAIGLYTDVRLAGQTPYWSGGTAGTADNLRVVPEPATIVMMLIGICGMGLIWLRKRG